MRKFLPLLAFCFIIQLTSITNLFAQSEQNQILFIFDSEEQLINSLRSTGKKVISFDIMGIETAREAKALKTSLEYSGDRVTGCKILKGKNGLYSGKLSLIAEVRVSHFTKILITCGIREIKVEGTRIRTSDLNEKALQYTE